MFDGFEAIDRWRGDVVGAEAASEARTCISFCPATGCRRASRWRPGAGEVAAYGGELVDGTVEALLLGFRVRLTDTRVLRAPRVL